MSIRKFIPKLVLVTAAAGGLVLVSAGSAGASSAVDDAKVVLDELCEARGGDAVLHAVLDHSVPVRTRQQGLRDRAGGLRGARGRRVHPRARHQPHEPGVVGLFPDVAARVMSRPAGWSDCHTAPAGPPRSLGWRRDRGCGYWVVTASSRTSIAGCGPGVSSR